MFRVYCHAHPSIPVVMVRADHGTYPDVSGLNVGIDLDAEGARRLAADLLAAAADIEGREQRGDPA